MILIFSFSSFFSQAKELDDKLKALQDKYNFSFRQLETEKFFSEKYLLTFEQPLNHNDPQSGTFTQRIFLSHLDFQSPVVFITEGYAAGYASYSNYINELSLILNGNQVCVEHRFFGESLPDPLNWEYLNVYQAASDHHNIIEFIQEVYSGPIVNTGISKGGQTAMYHRYFFPDDVKATVAYVSPLNFSIEDKRIYQFLENVGDSTTRKRIFDYQMEMFRNKNLYLPEFEKLAVKKGLTFSMGLLQGYELTVLEYSFAFWQWGITPVDSIPMPATSPENMVHHLNQVAGIDWVSNEGIDKIYPFFYQALTEIGFYGYDITPFQDFISFQENPTFDFTIVEDLNIHYDPEPMQQVDCFIRHQAKNMIFIYGETDPWTATSVDLTYNQGLLKIIKPHGSHLTRISNLPEEEQRLVITTLKNWLQTD
ncbi:MAG: peptidase [Bacteroidetes bacterium]|nr:peptidase [Bacteroidota bacterium]